MKYRSNTALDEGKFLASSLIVEELSRSRHALAQRSEELEHSGRRLLVERSELRSCLAATHNVVAALNTAFDPLAAGREEGVGQGDVLQLAGGVLEVDGEVVGRLRTTPCVTG